MTRDPLCDFEVTIRRSDAGYARLGRMLVERVGLLKDSALRSDDEADLLLQLPVPGYHGLMELLRPVDWRYRSPTRFERGGMAPIYLTAEQEVAARVCMVAAQFGSESVDPARWDDARRAVRKAVSEVESINPTPERVYAKLSTAGSAIRYAPNQQPALDALNEAMEEANNAKLLWSPWESDQDQHVTKLHRAILDALRAVRALKEES